jgi:hypothetical protein
MLAYYGSRLSANMTRTPEGYLICHNVPIARTGTQKYLGRELRLLDRPDQIITVYRLPDDVFAPATLASGEGKPTTDNHPPKHLTAETIAGFAKGHAQNIRRGTGEEEDLLLADLFFTDPVTIAEIENGKREISCGYECIYEPHEDGYKQTSILINHVALVTAGRAGSRVAIKDSKPVELERGKKPMKITKNILAALGFKHFVQDAEPEQIAEAAQALAGNETPAPAAPPQGADPIQALTQAVAQLQAQVAQLLQAKQPTAPQDALDALESELGGSDDPDGDKGAKVIEPEKKDDEPAKAADASGYMPRQSNTTGIRPPKGGTGESGVRGATDSAAVLGMVRTLKPVVAQIKDAAVRKEVSDAMAGALRNTMGTNPAQQTVSPYAALTQPQQPTQDGKPEIKDVGDIGENIMKNRNPHYKGGK